MTAELGSSREVISRILEAFQENGLVALERGEIRILKVQLSIGHLADAVPVIWRDNPTCRSVDSSQSIVVARF